MSKEFFLDEYGAEYKNGINLFRIESYNEEMIKQFYTFFKAYDLIPLFNNDHKTNQIKVTDNDLRSVINNGKYAQVLKDFKDVLWIATKNDRYEMAIFDLIEGINSFQKLMNNLKKATDYINSTIQMRHLFNTWNIVYYNDKLEF